MPLSSTKYCRPGSLAELASMAEDGVFLAGGTDLLVQVRNGRKKPQKIVSLRDIPELRDIQCEQGMVTVGAMVTHEEVYESPLLREKAPLLAEAAGAVGSPQIRNRGTIGGNIANASPAADTVPALMALDAVVEVVGGTGTREVALREFFLGPGKTVLAQGEVIKGVRFAALRDNQAGAFIKHGKRNALAISVVNCGVVIGIDRETMTFTEARISLGAVAPTVIRLEAAEQILVGQKISRPVIEEAAAAVKAGVKPITDIRSTGEYRKDISEQLALRAIAAALAKLGITF
ncbi:MAG TPA: xanthine dehydrogenase family protein subunit M [Clostridia bacterium]|nr:xanthine dehydrogenase family protein subunit M [Clostridia bacterium]